MSDFEHERHKPPRELSQPRPLVLLCAPLRSNVNLSRIIRTATCCGVTRIVACGNPRIDPKIARDGVDLATITVRRSLLPLLSEFADEGYQLVGLEQTTHSEDLHHFNFVQRTALVIGNERTGLTDEVLRRLDRVCEIPVWGRPFSYNVATATSMTLYEYCRQFPNG